MNVIFHPHALVRMSERGTTQAEVAATIAGGEEFAAKFGRVGFRRNFAYNGIWRGKVYATKQIEAYAVNRVRRVVGHHGHRQVLLRNPHP